MLNYETLLSSYDDKLTLMQWLKKVEAALKDASAVGFDVNKKGDATLTFSITFEDGSKLESGEFVLQQGESVESAAIVNGHLILTLTNGDELDAGQLLNGDLNVSGNLAATGKITGAEIVEDMTGYAGELQIPANATNTGLYLGICKNGNKLTFVACGIINKNAVGGYRPLAKFYIPQSVNDKLVPFSGTKFDIRPFSFIANYETDAPSSVSSFFSMTKGTGANPTLYLSADLENLTMGTDYFYRIEATFLLGQNFAG